VSSAVVASSSRWAASSSSTTSVASFFGFSPEDFGAVARALSEFDSRPVGFVDSDGAVLVAPDPDAIAAATPTVTIPAPSHTKNRSTMPPPVLDIGKIKRVVSRGSRYRN